MATFFTADTHFGDAHVLRQRGTRHLDIEAHDAALTAAWNAAVGDDDDVWHLGDFAVGLGAADCAARFGRLAGRKYLVRGNHDTNRVLDLPWAAAPVDSMRLMVRDAAGREWRLFLAHYPQRSWPGLWRGARHLYGHTHGLIADMTRACDVGVDAWGDAPASLDAILARQEAATVVPEELALRP